MTKSRDTADILEDVKVDGNVTAVGQETLKDNTGIHNTGVGYRAMFNSSLSGSSNVALGNYNLYANTSGASNTALGYQSLFSNTTASNNTAVGYKAGYANTTGTLTATGRTALENNTTGVDNTATGRATMSQNTTGGYNTAVGALALLLNTTASNNTAVGYRASHDNTTGTRNVSMGKDAMYQTTTGNDLVGIGYEALTRNTTGANNVAIGKETLSRNTTGNHNVAVGYEAGYSNTTGTNNTVVGRDAGYSNQTADGNVFIGEYAGRNTTNSNNTFLGTSSGWQVTSGQKNTILGRYNGNQNGLDIRTLSNRIVLSDGDGNPRIYVDNDGKIGFGKVNNISDVAHTGASISNTGWGMFCRDSGTALYVGRNINTGTLVEFWQAGGLKGNISTNGTSVSYNTSSDYRLKENVDYTWDATARLKQLKPARFNFITDADTTVDGFLAHEAQAVVPECVTGTKDAVGADGNPEYQGIDQSKLVPLLVKTIQELEARITALEGA